MFNFSIGNVCEYGYNISYIPEHQFVVEVVCSLCSKSVIGWILGKSALSPATASISPKKISSLSSYIIYIIYNINYITYTTYNNKESLTLVVKKFELAKLLRTLLLHKLHNTNYIRETLER